MDQELIRTFISIRPDDSALRELVKLQRRLKVQIPDSVMRWTPPEHLHMTLVFLGDVDPICVDELNNQLFHVVHKFRPIDLWAASVGAFPKFEKPNLVFANVSAAQNLLNELQSELCMVTKTFSSHQETHAFHPHLTLARVRRGQFRQARKAGDFLRALNLTDVVRWKATKIKLMKSDLSGKTPVYSCLREYELGSE